MKTLQEYKDERAQKYGHTSFTNFNIKCYQDKVHGQMDLIALMDEAAELYSDQFKNVIDAIEEGSNQWKQEYDDSRSILNELVCLKDIKDKSGKTKEYYEKQPIAWKEAKDFLSKYQHQ